MLKKISDKTKKIIYIVSFFSLIILFGVLVMLTMDSQRILDIKEFIGIDTKLLYITQDESLNYPIKILDKYSIDYLKINSNELTVFERKKLENIVNGDNLKNLLIIYVNGNIEDALIEYESEESVNKFLQENNIIPDIVADNVDEIITEANGLLDNEYSMIYIPYKNMDAIEKQDKILSHIAEEYSIEYKKIDAYLLSSNQQEKLNKLLGLSFVEDQILVLIKNKKMIANIRGVHSKNTYIENLYNVNFINELENKINEIDYEVYKELLKSQEKNIIVIGSDSLKDSNDVIKLLNGMIYNYNIEVNYININEIDSHVYSKVKNKLEDIGYEGAFSLPLVVIVESNKILDYAIGNSKEEYFIDTFIENGVIKGDAINE